MKRYFQVGTKWQSRAVLYLLYESSKHTFAYNVGKMSEQAYKAHDGGKGTAWKIKKNDSASADNQDFTTPVFTMYQQAV